MATYQVLSWKDVPALVEARDEGGMVTRELSERFQILIDSVAMQAGASESDAYLEHWTRSAPAERPGSAEEVADAVAADLEHRFTEVIARAFGRDVHSS